MPVSFNVASHVANPVRGVNPSGLSSRDVLAGCHPPGRSVGTMRGTSFSKEEQDLLLPAPTPPESHPKPKPKKSRLSRLFSLKKAVEVEDAPVATPAPKIPDPRTCVAIRTAMLDASNPTSLDASPPTVPGEVKNVIPKPNGFVDTVVSAYNQHHALVLRPDDVWIAILTQFNFFVNARAELLRANFVAHDGSKALVVKRDAFDDFELFALDMAGLIEKNVVDPALRKWALPAFFHHDADRHCRGCHGPNGHAPRKSDWEAIRARLEKLKEYGLETIAWYHLLVPVISRFVTAFDNPTAPSNIIFWQNVVHYEPQGSGPDYYSGWITAFCVFSADGKWMGPALDKDVKSPFVAPESMSAARFWDVYGEKRSYKFTLDDTPFHTTEVNCVPASYAEVDVRLVSTGENQECMITAGVVGTRVCSSNDKRLSASGQDDTVRPVVGWWLYHKK
ncbi:hypothetical protein B0H14DRAFT_3864875 [Mycena olivaceomarginata]|nr:hypothetical protein B0H14DRAFT_3864875 [Mycena olivaceomarginata]